MQNIDIKVPAKDRAYAISFYNDFNSQFESLEKQIGDRNFIVVTDENVQKKTTFIKYFNDSKVCCLSPGELEKNWDSVDKILTAAFDAKLDRDSVIVVVGGGVVGDMAGFAASIFMRGIPFIQIPTTLLAMVDSSVGGKTGIDCMHGKNLIGTITPPESILICQIFLETLEDIEIKNGIAEMVKHGIIAKPKHFEVLEKLSESRFEQVRKNIFDHVVDSIQIKKAIVEEDEYERGIRGFLNLGHTFGHAIELCSNFEIPHGRAVAIGCVMAANYAEERGICESDLVDRIENIFNQFEIDLTCEIPEEDLWKAMLHDKKKKGGNIRLILPKQIGKVEYFDVDMS